MCQVLIMSLFWNFLNIRKYDRVLNEGAGGKDGDCETITRALQ